jgi:hypothetical protein
VILTSTCPSRTSSFHNLVQNRFDVVHSANSAGGFFSNFEHCSEQCHPNTYGFLFFGGSNYEKRANTTISLIPK